MGAFVILTASGAAWAADEARDGGEAPSAAERPPNISSQRQRSSFPLACARVAPPPTFL